MTEFQRQFATFLDEFAADQPIAATSIGDHRYDGRWPDVTDDGQAGTLALIDRWLGVFRDLDPASLEADDAIDRDLMVAELEAQRFDLTELQDDRWDPLSWVYVFGDALFPLIARDFAPLADRLTSVAERLEGMPAFLAGAAAAIRPTDDGRPVARLQTETAIAQLPGVAELVDDALAEAAGAAPEDAAVAALRPRLEAAAVAAKGALATFTGHLRDVVLPTTEGEGRLGRDLFARKLQHTMRSPALTPERIIDEAEAQYAAVRAEMVRLAREGWERWLPGDTDAGRSERPRARGPGRHRGRAPGCRGPARLLPRGERPHRGVLSRARSDRPRRRAAGHPLDAGVPAGVRRCDAHLARTAGQGPDQLLRHHPDAGRLVTPSARSRTCARTTTGCCAC